MVATTDYHVGTPFFPTKGEEENYGWKQGKKGQFPYLVSLNFVLTKIVDEQDVIKPHCGASLIHPHWILTAAHCLHVDGLLAAFMEKYPEEGKVVSKCFTAYMGTIWKNDSRAQNHQIKSIHLHPDYKETDFPKLGWGVLNDVAVGQLKEPFKLNANVKTIPLPPKSLLKGKELRKVFKLCTVSGYGLLKETIENNVIKPVKSDRLMFLRFVPKTWKQVYKQRKTWFKFQKQIFLIDKSKEHSVMRGDSGSPLACGGYQFGVTSASFKVAQVNLFESVSQHENFIRSHVPKVIFDGGRNPNKSKKKHHNRFCS